MVLPGPALPPLVLLDPTELALLDVLLREASVLLRAEALSEDIIPAILVATVMNTMADMAQVSTVTHMAMVMAMAITVTIPVMVLATRELPPVSSLLAQAAPAPALDLAAHKYL